MDVEDEPRRGVRSQDTVDLEQDLCSQPLFIIMTASHARLQDDRVRGCRDLRWNAWESPIGGVAEGACAQQKTSGPLKHPALAVSHLLT